MKIPLNVKYEKKEYAKKDGARFDWENKIWFIENLDSFEILNKWGDKDFNIFLVGNIFIIQEFRQCYNCGKLTKVYAIGTDRYLQKDETKKWSLCTEFRVFYYIKKCSANLNLILKNNNIYMSMEYSKAINKKYMMNLCEHCKIKQGDNYLYEEFDSVFEYLGNENIDTIKLEKFKIPNIDMAIGLNAQVYEERNCKNGDVEFIIDQSIDNPEKNNTDKKLYDDYIKLLSCWHRLENYNPHTIDNTYKILEQEIPWSLSALSDRNENINYIISLGVFDLNEVNAFIQKFFDDKDSDENFSSSKICYAKMKIDSQGKYIIDSFSLSIFPWALGQLENNNIDTSDWLNTFEIIKSKCSAFIESKLITFNDDMENIHIVSYFDLLNIQNYIQRICRYSINTDTKIYFKKINLDIQQDDSEILNSFYIKDLEKIINNYIANNIPKGLKQYLDGCLNKEIYRQDISRDTSCLQNILSPENFPDGCWPSNYTLSLMQQFAVNNIFNELSDYNSSGIISVNGPPGTGKTTLLRDIIAPIIVNKAKQMVKIQKPETAFQYIGKKELSNGYSPYIYVANQELTYFGILIASSNNGAVENISKELPLKSEVSENYCDKISYLKGVAESCINENNWGLISAVLGNKTNTKNLIDSLWFNTKNNLRNDFRDSCYDCESWEKIKEKFNNKLQEIHIEKTALNKIKTKKMVEYFDLEKNKIKERIKEIKKAKPNIFVYIFNSKERKNYKEKLFNIKESYSMICGNLKLEIKKLQQIKNELNDKYIIEISKQDLKNNYADYKFWENIEKKEVQEACPWYSKKLKQLESELFILALQVNETFIKVANSKSNRIITTLSAFFEYLKGNVEFNKQEIKAMWDIFFLVIPVISSTFASIQTLFKDLGKEDISWLFIDEAGQAIPQAAVGAIWRSKRSVIVGDPFQIEPVVTIPNLITKNISKYFDLNKNQINSELSVQSMADRANKIGAYLNINGKQNWIGIPLRVHRRCINPMFSIANEIAYDNTMFCCTLPPKIETVDFKTEFIDCKGYVKGKHFVPEQAELIISILQNEIQIYQQLPNVFIITPFKEISIKLRKFINGEFVLLLNKSVYKLNFTEAEIKNWVKTHIGTVHTFQGKQADGVILCLGLDKNTQAAANWASQKPNLLNVAITRAKYKFIAIGDKEIWLTKSYFSRLKELSNS